MDTKTRTSISFGTLIFIILFILKIIGQTDMSWFWVLTSWIWVPIAAMLAGMFLVFCFGAIAVIFAAILAKF
jgi:hypothetical protein